MLSTLPIKKMIQNLSINHRLSSGIFANVLSIGILALCGLMINIILGKCYGAEGLGLFNLVMALFIVFSQFSTFGLHHSILRYTSEHHNNKEEIKKILSSGLLLCFLLSITIAIGAFFSCLFIEKIFKFQHVSEAWLLTIPGVIFFSLNKSFFAFLNGQNRMVTFAGLTSLRYLGLLTFLILLIYKSCPLYAVGAAITLSELIVCASCFWIVGDKIVWSLNATKWYKKHWNFGCKSFLGGVSVELNSCVDVLILSYFTNEVIVGIYSVALFVITGLLQFVVVVRNSLNPLITQYFYAKEYEQLEKKISEICSFFLIGMFCLSLISIVLYYFYINFFFIDNIWSSMYVFLILLVGIAFSAYYLPLQFFANQIGNPLHQSYINLAIFLGNILLNIYLTYEFGLYGAAIATSLSFILSAYIIRQYIKTSLK